MSSLDLDKVGAMDIRESLNRILQQKQAVADLFYVAFLEHDPEVQREFAGVNMMHQAVLLTMALMVMERHYTGSYPATEAYLKYLGTRHHDRGVAPEFYPKFRDALLLTLERFHGEDWNGPLAAQWRGAIDLAWEAMLEGYKHHFTV
jgi:hemoglobin-like flavoprotein